MAQTTEGARKVRAKALGLSVEEYVARLDSGNLWCTGCKAWHSEEAFGRDSSRSSGRAATCLDFRRRRYSETYVPRPPVPRGRSFVPARDGDRRQARRRVNYFVEAGLLPNPCDLPCSDCGKRWTDGTPRYEYDHYLGYAAEHHEDVQAVCQPCHEIREKDRRNGS
jgi:hypothetical protein